MIYVFRHAHAGRRKDFQGPDHLRPLTERGRRESKLVAEDLAANGISRILTSPYTRCVQSVAPLSDATGLPAEVDLRLAEETPGSEVDALLAEIGPETVLCSHGDIISGLIGRIAAEGARLDAGLIWEKGSVWRLEHEPLSRAGHFAFGVYTPPPITGS